MKDRLLLLIVAVLASAASWAFFHYLGERAFVVLFAMVALALLRGGGAAGRRAGAQHQEAALAWTYAGRRTTSGAPSIVMAHRWSGQWGT